MAEERQIILDISANTGKLNTRLEGVNKELLQQKEELQQLNKAYKQGLVSQDQYIKESTKLQKSQKALRKEQREVTKQLELQEKATDSLEGSNEQLRAQLSLLTKEYNKLSKEQRETTDSGKALESQIRDISDELKRNEKQVGDNRRNVGNYESAFDGLGGKLGKFGAAIAGPAGIAFAVEALGEQLIEGAKAVVEIEKEFTQLRGTIQLTTGAIEEELDNLTIAYAATAEVFQVETEEINKAVLALRDNFGTELPRAIELVQTGLLGVANQGEFLGLVSEELSKLVGLGISEDSAIAFLVEATNRGINPDILAEPLLALREQTPATLEALNAAFGPSGTQRLLDTFANDPIKGIQAVSNRFSELDGTSKEAGLLLADVFKSPGEDAIALAGALGELNFNLSETIDETNELTQQQKEQLEVEIELAAAKNEIAKELAGLSAGTGNLTKQIQTGLLQAFVFLIQKGKEVTNFFIELYNESIAFRGVIEGIVLGFRNSIATIKLFFNQLVDGFKNVGALIKAVFTGNFRAIPGIIKEAFDDAKTNLVDFAFEVKDNVEKAVETTINGSAEKLSEAPAIFKEAGMQSGESFVSGVADGIGAGAEAIETELEKIRKRVGKISISGFGDFEGVTDEQQREQERIKRERETGQAILNERAALDAKLLQQAQNAANEQVNVTREQTQEEIAESQRRVAALEEEKNKRLAIAGAVNSAISSGAELFRNLTEEEIAAARESSAAEKARGVTQASIDTYVAANRALASGLPIPANFIAAAAAIASGLANVRTILGFAQGGVIPSSARNLQQPRSNGDNVLITARTGEAIVNERQQKAIGIHNFRRAGVPGFATGGVVGSSNNLATMANRQAAEADAQGAQLITQLRNMPAPIVTVKDISTAQKRVNVKQSVARL